jgi:lysozyme family protein
VIHIIGMADFKIAEQITGINEGGYAFNPHDRGGETYAGIARKFWPSWEGWVYIDKYKAQYYKLNKPMQEKYSLARWINSSAKVTSEPIAPLVSQFYKTNFWDLNKLDQIKDQQIANSVYDFGVNSGKGRAVQFLEQIFGVKKDGIMDPQVIALVNKSDPKVIFEKYKDAREAAYRSWATGDQAQFLGSWLSRLSNYKVSA